MNSKQRENWLGLTTQKFKQKYVFNEQCTADSFYFDRLRATPSELDGLPQELQSKCRSLACQMLTEAGIFLKLPITTVVASQTILQFFYMRESLLKYDFRDIVMGAMFLAAKSEETIRWSGHVAMVFDQVFRIHEKERRPTRVADFGSTEQQWMQRKVLESQRVILVTLGFEVYRLLETPHRYMNTLFLEFKGHPRIQQIVRKAWGYLNDSYRSRVCTFYPGQVIAAASVQLSLRVLQIKSPCEPWWCLLEASKEMVEDLMVEMLAVYQNSEGFAGVQEALARAGSARNLPHVFPVTYFRRIHNAIRQSQKQEQARFEQEKAKLQQEKQKVIEIKEIKETVTVEKQQDRKASQPSAKRERSRSNQSRSRSRRKQKRKKHHKHKSRSRQRSRSGKRKDRKHKKSHRRSTSSQSSPPSKKQPNPQSLPPPNPEPPKPQPKTISKQQLKKQISLLTSKIPKKPNPQPQEKIIMQDLRAKILRKKQQPCSPNQVNKPFPPLDPSDLL